MANDGGNVALRRAAEDRAGMRYRKDVKKNTFYSRRLLMISAATDFK